MERELVVVVRDLVKVYREGGEVWALNGLTMTVSRGEFVAIMGPSGSGKSTLLHILGALDRPTSGEVWVNGQNLARIRDLDTFRARTVGFVFQLHNLIPTLTARENVEVPMIGQPISRRERRRRAEELLERVGLRDRMNHLPSQMSGGERQRVAIARALANCPILLLADEPTGNLDSQSGAEIVALLRELNRDLGMTIILVTHNPWVARSADRILLMRDGRIVGERRPEEIVLNIL